MGIGFLGVSFAFGLTVLTMAYAVGHVSGGHFNLRRHDRPVGRRPLQGGATSSLTSSRRSLGAIAGGGGALCDRVAASPAGCPADFASNGYGDLSPGKYGLGVVLPRRKCWRRSSSCYVIIGTTSKGAAVGFAGIPIGLCLTLIHLFLIPVTNASVNPARSTGPALFAGGAYIGAALAVLARAHRSARLLAGVVARWQHEADHK